MSLLNFFKRDNSKAVAKPAQAVSMTPATRVLVGVKPATPPPAAAATAVAAEDAPTEARAGSNGSDSLDIERIRMELMEIARIVGGEDAGETSSGTTLDDLAMVDLKLTDIMRIIPDAFRPGLEIDSSNTTLLSVMIPDLFDQLSRGRVDTTIGRLVADIPEDYLTPYVDEHTDDKVSIPLAVVVASVQPGELRKRTAAKERDHGERLLPNLFSRGSIAAAAMPVVEPSQPDAAAEPEPVAEGPALPVAAEPPQPITAEEQPLVETSAEATEVAEQTVDEPAPAEAALENLEPVAAAEEPVIEAEPEVASPEQTAAVADEPVRQPEPEPIIVETPVSGCEPLAAEPIVVQEPQGAPVEEEAQVAAVAAELPAAVEPAAIAAPVPVLGEVEPETDEIESDEEYEAVTAGVSISSGTGVMVAGIDLNRASAEELYQRLPGVGRKLAEKIVQERETNGAFVSIHDLIRVEGLRHKVFEQLTGISLHPAQFRYREVIRQLLGPEGTVPDVREVARRFKEFKDYDGCLITLEDGFALAGSWDHPAADSLGAFAPQMYKKISRYVRQLNLGDLKCIVFFLEAQPVAVVRSGRILFAALLSSAKLAQRQVELVQAIGQELGRRLSA